MNPLVFISADSRECRHWISKWSDRKKADLPVHWALSGLWNQQPVIAIANGAGPEQGEAAVVAVADLRPIAVVSIGTCGALDSSLKLGEIFVPDQIRSGNRSWLVRAPAGPISRMGPLISISRIAGTSAEKARLRATGALAVEMESAGVARAAERFGVPFYCVRAVSDLANEDFANDFNEVLMPDGRLDIAALLLNSLAKPLARIPELYRLAKRSDLASKNMGEFLALCSF